MLDSLKRYTTVVADTGDFDSIARYKPQDATTNPSLLYQAAQKPQYEHLLSDALRHAGRFPGDQAARTEVFMDKLLVNFGCEILKIIPGRVSTEVDADLSFDTAGPMARHVYDVAATLGVIAGFDPADEATRTSEGKKEADYTKFLDKDALKGARLGIARDFMGLDPEVDWIVHASLDAMRTAGATFVDVRFPRWFLASREELYFTIRHREFRAQIAEYLKELDRADEAEAGELDKEEEAARVRALLEKLKKKQGGLEALDEAIARSGQKILVTSEPEARSMAFPAGVRAPGLRNTLSSMPILPISCSKPDR